MSDAFDGVAREWYVRGEAFKEAGMSEATQISLARMLAKLLRERFGPLVDAADRAEPYLFNSPLEGVLDVHAALVAALAAVQERT